MRGQFLKVEAIPSEGINGKMLLDAIGKRSFAVIYDLHDRSTKLYIETDQDGKALEKLLSHTAKIDARLCKPVELEEGICIAFYKRASGIGLIKDIIGSQFRDGKVILFFKVQDEKSAEEFKKRLESRLSNQGVKSTLSIPGSLFSPSTSLHRDEYESSEERELLLSVLEDINKTVLSGLQAYRIVMEITGKSADAIKSELERHIIAMHIEKKGKMEWDDAFELANKWDGMHYGSDYISSLIEAYGSGLHYPVKTAERKGKRAGISIGTYVENGITETNEKIRIPLDSFNLGFIISGLPGSGKTTEAMSIVHQIRKHMPNIAILAPTNEWNAFAARHGMECISIASDKRPINFFSCPSSNTVKFYENLAMLVASASNSGPYEGPMEKCLLNAFENAYQKTREPNPSYVYDCIEESIIKLHGKRTNTGIKYTKHGENIHASLENLKSIIMKDEYSCSKGLQFRKLIEKGVVFDLSEVSNAIKPYFYALILNQLYAIADDFDVYGDRKLRMLIGIEEAQMIFGSAEDTAAATDLANRIQDFRKKGIGLMLIVHSITDIKSEIRRLCQNKIYLKQAPDVAAIAAKELVFTYALQDEIIAKLKHLSQRIGAFDSSQRGVNSSDSMFIKTNNYLCNESKEPVKARHGSASMQIDAYIKINDARQERKRESKPILALSVSYLGNEEYAEKVGDAFKVRMLEGRYYEIMLKTEGMKLIGTCKLFAKSNATICINDSSTYEETA